MHSSRRPWSQGYSIVERAYAAYGLILVRDARWAYDPGRRAIDVSQDGNDPVMMLHDLGHFLTAPSWAIGMPEFGLGPAPHFMGLYAPDDLAVIRDAENATKGRDPRYYAHGESAACWAHIRLTQFYFGERAAEFIASWLSSVELLDYGSDAVKRVQRFIQAWGGDDGTTNA